MSSFFGATSVGVKAGEGVALATDRRMAYGTFIMSRNARKVFRINDRIGIVFAGLYGDISGLVRILRADLKSYELTTGNPITTYMTAKRLSLIMYSYKMLPFIVETIVGGLDPDGTPRLYVLDSLGSITEEPYAAVGTGATIAYGYLEANYREDMSGDEALQIAINAVKTAIVRDAGTGDGIDAVLISKEGVREESVKLRVRVEEG
ncbi:MAG: proteasome subunit beta [Desulfurococcales archaeon]|nr:proteasome subunit beta [Desulfurococcales archaeon]